MNRRRQDREEHRKEPLQEFLTVRPRQLAMAWIELRSGQFRPGKVVALPVLSGSMLPILVPRRRIRIQGASWQHCQIGDVVVFRDDMRLVAHRLLLSLQVIGQRYLLVKGDANDLGQWIHAEQVVGLVLGAESGPGDYLDLRSAEARRRALTVARRQLVRDFCFRLTYVPRGAARWLQKTPANVGSAWAKLFSR